MGVMHQCLACGAPVECDRKPRREYKFTLDDADVSLLLKIWHEVVQSGRNDVHVGNIGAGYTERSRVTQVRLHALIAKVKNPWGTHKAGHWLITTRGGQFLRNEVSVPEVVVSDDQGVIRHEGRMVRITDFRKLDDWGPHFSWTIVDDQLVRTNDQSKLPL